MRSGHRLSIPLPKARRARDEQKYAPSLAGYRGGRLPVASLIALLALGLPAVAGTEDYSVPRLDKDLNVVMQPQDDGAAVQDARPTAPAKPAAPACVAIHELTLSGVSVLPVSELLAGLPQTGCFSVEEMFGFAAEITNRYVAAGFVTSRAFLPEQDLSAGKLEIVAVEGRVEEIELVENGRIRRIGAAALPAMVGQVLHIRRIEQGLDQINALASKDAKISFRPGKEAGWSIVEVAITSAPGWSIRSSIDNQNDTGDGKVQGATTITIEDTFGAFETLSYARKRNLATDHGRRLSTTDTVNFSMPIGDWTIGWSVEATSYKSMFYGQGQEFETTGDTLSNEGFIERLLYRDQVSKTHLRASLRVEASRNFFEESLINVSSRTISVGTIELSHSTQLLGGSVSARAGLHQGLPLFAANDNGGPLAIFTILDGQFDYGIPFGNGFSFSTSISGQWSPDALYTSEQLSLGGSSSIRGFKKDALLGENGVSVRNELAYTLPSLGPGVDAIFGSLSVFGAIDAGWILPGAGEVQTATNLSGGAAGVRASNGKFFGSASWEFPLHGPQTFDQTGAFRFEAGLTLSQF